PFVRQRLRRARGVPSDALLERHEGDGWSYGRPGAMKPLPNDLVETAMGIVAAVVVTEPGWLLRSMAWGAPTVSNAAAVATVGAPGCPRPGAGGGCSARRPTRMCAPGCPMQRLRWLRHPEPTRPYDHGKPTDRSSGGTPRGPRSRADRPVVARACAPACDAGEPVDPAQARGPASHPGQARGPPDHRPRCPTGHPAQ